MKLPLPVTDTELVLLLLREDLKSNRLFTILRSLNFEDDFFQSDFSAIVLTCLGINSEDDHWNDVYDTLLDKHSQLPALDNIAFSVEALAMYQELVRMRGVTS